MAQGVGDATLTTGSGRPLNSLEGEDFGWKAKLQEETANLGVSGIAEGGKMGEDSMGGRVQAGGANSQDDQQKVLRAVSEPRATPVQTMELYLLIQGLNLAHCLYFSFNIV